MDVAGKDLFLNLMWKIVSILEKQVEIEDDEYVMIVSIVIMMFINFS